MTQAVSPLKEQRGLESVQLQLKERRLTEISRDVPGHTLAETGPNGGYGPCMLTLQCATAHLPDFNVRPGQLRVVEFQD